MRVSSMLGVWQGALVVALLGVAGANYYDDQIDDQDFINELYKRISEMEAQDSDYYNQLPLETRGWDDEIEIGSRDSSQAEIRDHEYLEHAGSKGGFQYISGGAGEGAQHLTPEGTQNNTQEVKSDEALPFYCHPPNPCPKGYTEEDGCQMDVKDTAESQREWINNMMKKGRCSCDEEHMFNCPKDLDRMNTVKGHEGRDNLDNMLNDLLGEKSNYVNPYMTGGNKRESLVAKKAPIMWKPDAQDPAENPFLGGEQIHTVAKKGVWMK